MGCGPMDDMGQIYTIEGFASALILIGVLLIVFSSITVVTPQTEMTTDMKAYQSAADVITIVDRPNEAHGSDLKGWVAGWNGGCSNYSCSVSPGEKGMAALDGQIASLLPSDMMYNVELSYYDGNSEVTVPVITHGVPGDNSNIATGMVTLNGFDNTSAYWTGRARFPQLVQARLTVWYL